MNAQLQRILRAIYPDQCLSCGEPTDRSTALCAECWSQTRFILGHHCEQCGAPLPGVGDGTPDLCDQCLAHRRPWQRGRAAIGYEGVGKSLVLAMKHGDRPDHARPMGHWMARAGVDILSQSPLLIPVPLHWTRLFTRRFNQAAELARVIAEAEGLDWCPDALRRVRRTPPLGTLNSAERQRLLSQAIDVSPNRRKALDGRNVCLIDDVMTSGATLGACSDACLRAGAKEVCVLALARAGLPP